ncbi:hypothetical protein JXA47_05715 [Candidatus Sumerlaeota bacterium]|nr:hypothetical protein [Candidatus Sumerlaeota bacterium]
MARRLQFPLLLIACLTVVALVKMFALSSPPDVREALDLTQQRLDAIQTALAARTELPTSPDWAADLGLQPADVADPFSLPADSEPFSYWSDGRWYALRSVGPDMLTAQELANVSVSSELTYRSARSFPIQLLAQRNASELESLLGEDGIVGDIRFRADIYDPTNGLNSPGDIVRWGSRAPSGQSTYDPTNGTVSRSGSSLRVRQ